MGPDTLVRRLPLRLERDPGRVVAQLFVPGHALPGVREGRASGVIGHVLTLDDEAVHDALAEVLERFGPRHRDLVTTFRSHAERLRQRLDDVPALSDERSLLLGATFTHEYSVEAAALCNPSVVAAEDQRGVPDGDLRFVLSVRQIGEGHRSSIGFRSGTFDGRGGITLDERSVVTTPPAVSRSTLDAMGFRTLARRVDGTPEAAEWVLDRLDDRFTHEELDARLAELERQFDTRRDVVATVRRLRDVASRSYTATFHASSELSERVLQPATSGERNGIEDARFLRFVEEDGGATYLATYTAFDGSAISQQLLETRDWTTFTSSPLAGPGAANKGLALFPRRIRGRFVALARHDGATNGVTTSETMRHWPSPVPLDGRREVWEAVQVGNCGAPIETDAGWLVLTHGVGPMRTYCIGALLLDLDEPTKVLGRLPLPLLSPRPDEQDGYVPNVVYSCGALRHGPLLLIPYGIGDASIGFATAEVDDVLAAMVLP